MQDEELLDSASNKIILLGAVIMIAAAAVVGVFVSVYA